MIRLCVPVLVAVFLLCPAASQSQTWSTYPPSGVACPVEIRSFNPSGVTVYIRNTSGKTIVGLVFNAAIADATEHWKWIHWDFDDSRPLRDFGWNKAIKPGASKRLVWISNWYWGGAYLDFEHIGGGAFVLTSALFADGSEWTDAGNGEACSFFWYKHKTRSFRPVQLPPREAVRDSD